MTGPSASLQRTCHECNRGREGTIVPWLLLQKLPKTAEFQHLILKRSKTLLFNTKEISRMALASVLVASKSRFPGSVSIVLCMASRKSHYHHHSTALHCVVYHTPCIHKGRTHMLRQVRSLLVAEVLPGQVLVLADLLVVLHIEHTGSSGRQCQQEEQRLQWASPAACLRKSVYPIRALQACKTTAH